MQGTNVCAIVKVEMLAGRRLGDVHAADACMSSAVTRRAIVCRLKSVVASSHDWTETR